ncbi:PucR family transcriptional regulator [Leucobacter sp. BZR 635]|uniref:PucR family transcriptional regulator n=1 Tax=Leucobacter sp. BZR 635 TaxID=3378705 RepID=UPI003A88A53C
MMQYFAEPAIHSWIDLDTLLRDYELGLVVVAGGDDNTGARTVQWVHSSDLTDPTPFLTPRTVLLTTGAQFKTTLGLRAAEAYVSRLVAAGTTALGVGVGIKWDRIPPTLVEACERLGLPLIRVPYDTPFIAITRAAARLIDAAVHAQTIDRLTSTHSPRSTTAERSIAALAAAVIKLLVAGHKGLAEDIAGPLLPRLPRGQVSVIALAGSHPGLDLTALGDGHAAGLVDGRLLLVCEAAKIPAAKKLVRGLPGGLSERGALDDLGELVAQADRALEHALSEALPPDPAASSRAAGSGAGSTGTGAPLRGKLVEYRPAMHAGLLQLIGQSQDARRRATGFLSPVRTHDLRHGDEIERSLEAWLRHNGQLSPAAEELEIHRHTLRARIRTAASLLQRDIDSPDTRAELWTALRILSPAHLPTQP